MSNFSVDFNSNPYNPRSYIYKLLQKNISNLEDFRKAIQYNGFKQPNSNIPNDPSYNDPTNGISSRSDLLGSPHGGVDFKV